jgi:hypothetical protein
MRDLSNGFWRIMIATEWHVARRAALVLALVMLSGCGDQPRRDQPIMDQPAMGQPSSYRALITNYIKRMKGNASYTMFEISDPRWVSSLHGWTWLVCLRFRDRGHQRTYTFFIPEKADALNDSDSRYSVMTDECDTQNYSPLDVSNSMGVLY